MKNILFLLALAASAGTFSASVSAEIICFDDGIFVEIGDPGVPL